MVKALTKGGRKGLVPVFFTLGGWASEPRRLGGSYRELCDVQGHPRAEQLCLCIRACCSEVGTMGIHAKEAHT